jgi:AAA15 family ATPase/GTPase
MKTRYIDAELFDIIKEELPATNPKKFQAQRNKHGKKYMKSQFDYFSGNLLLVTKWFTKNPEKKSYYIVIRDERNISDRCRVLLKIAL